MTVEQRLRQTITVEQLDKALGGECPWADGALFAGYFDANVTGGTTSTIPAFSYPSMKEGTHAIQLDDIDFVVMTEIVEGDYIIETPCCIALKHGRFDRDGVRQFAAWSTWRDVTGTSFHADAYGGDAQIFLGGTADLALGALDDIEGLTTSRVEYSSMDYEVEQVMLDVKLRADHGHGLQLLEIAKRHQYPGSVLFRLEWASKITALTDIEDT